jgi:hypothetical protein
MARGEGVKHLKDLFAKYREQLIAPEATVVTAFIEVVHDVLGVSLTKESVSYTPANRTLTVRASGVLKNEIALHTEELLAHMKGRVGVKAAPKTIL